MEGRYADSENVTLVLDNLNTHTMGALYQAFESARACDMVRPIEFLYMP